MATASQERTDRVRAVVFREEDGYVAQCIDYDISAQGADIDSALDRLELTIEAESAWSQEKGVTPFQGIPPAPNYFHTLFDQGSLAIKRVNVAVDHMTIEAMFSKAA